MATVIGIFESQYLDQKYLMSVVRPGIKLEDLLILVIQFKFVMKLLNQISVNIIVLATENHILY